MIREFRDFLLRGNVVDLAVAVVIGAAFGALVTSFVTNILTPLLGLLGVPDFATLTITTPGGAVIAYGLFLNALSAFILVALAIFYFVVKPMNALERRRQGGSRPHRPPRRAPIVRVRSPSSPSVAPSARSCNRRGADV